MRYGMADVANPQIEGQLLISGPQDEEQVSEEVKKLLARPGVIRVSIEYDHGTGRKMTLYNKIEEKSNVPKST